MSGKQIVIGKESLDSSQFYNRMLEIFHAQNKPKLELKGLDRFKKHQMTTFNSQGDILSAFNLGLANFFLSESAPKFFFNDSSAFGYVFRCYQTARNSEIRPLLADRRNASDWSMVDWKNFSSGDLDESTNLSIVICKVLHEIRNDRNYSRWEQNTICRYILSSAQARRMIEPKDSRKMQRDFNSKERKYRAVADRLLKQILTDRIMTENTNVALLAG